MSEATPRGVRDMRPVLYVTYSYDDPAEASMVDVSGSLKQATREARARGYGGYVYRLERQPDGTYGNESFVMELT